MAPVEHVLAPDEADTADPIGTAGAAETAVLARLRALLAAAAGDRVELPLAGLAELPLASIGLESWAFVSFLTSVEREFGIEWDIDTPPETFRSLGAVAAHLGSAAGDEASVPDARPHGGTS